MARLARVVLPGWPHHVLQRGVRSLPIFHTDEDRQIYLALLAKATTRASVRVWAWCLMTNHVHLVLVPASPTSLAEAMGRTHRHYTRRINFREGVRGHLFQERFHSFPIHTDRHLLAVIRYVERNPVRAKLVSRVEAYPWSSARHHVLGAPDPLVSASPGQDLVPDWKAFLAAGDADLDQLRQHTRNSRPFGPEAWVRTLEDQLGRPLRPQIGGWPKGRPRKLAGIQH